MAGDQKWFVLVNPSSGGGRGKKVWPAIKQELELQLFDFDFQLSQYPKHTLEIIKIAIGNGFKKFIAVGGDGTMHEMVNAAMTHNELKTSMFTLGLIPVGTGNDWARQYNIPMSIEGAVKRIAEGKLIKQDIGVLSPEQYPDKRVFFNNLSGIGFDGYVVEKVHRFKRWGALAYLLGALSGLMSYHGFQASVSWNDSSYSGKIFMLIVGIGRYSGGGMQLTSNPDPTDGSFDISLLPHLPKWRILQLLPKLFNGSVTKKEAVMSGKAKSLSIHMSSSDQAIIQADGELVGRGSFHVKVLPGAIQFII